jgi:hypothetical protein
MLRRGSRLLPLTTLFLALASCGGGPKPVPAPSPTSPGEPLPIAGTDLRCPGTQGVLSSLDQTLTIEAYVTRGTPRLDAFVEMHGSAFTYGSLKDVIPALSVDKTYGYEFWISYKIRDLVAKANHTRHKIGVLTGHDEIKLTDANLVPGQSRRKGPSIQDIILENFPTYDLVDVDLRGGEASIDDAIAGLIVTQPGKDLVEKELRRIDQFVMKGKSLAVIASSVDVAAGDATMSATLNAHGLERLLFGYGISTTPSPSSCLSTRVARHARHFRSCCTWSTTHASRGPKNCSTPPSRRSSVWRSSCSRASSLALHKDKQPGATTLEVLARSTPNAFHETSDKVDLKPFRLWSPGPQTPAQFDLAATVGGTLTSAFPGPGDRMGVDTPDRSAAHARVFVLAASQFLAHPFSRAAETASGGDKQLVALGQAYLTKTTLTAMILALKDTLDWLTTPDDLVNCSALPMSRLATASPMSRLVTAPPTADVEDATGCAVKACRGKATPEVTEALTLATRAAHRCYDVALVKEPTLQGTVRLATRIGEGGEVCSVRVTENELEDPSIADCIATNVSARHFPAPQGGCVDVVIPIVLVSPVKHRGAPQIKTTLQEYRHKRHVRHLAMTQRACNVTRSANVATSVLASRGPPAPQTGAGHVIVRGVIRADLGEHEVVARRERAAVPDAERIRLVPVHAVDRQILILSQRCRPRFVSARLDRQRDTPVVRRDPAGLVSDSPVAASDEPLAPVQVRMLSRLRRRQVACTAVRRWPFV